MKSLQRVGGIAALTGAATNLLGVVVFVTVMDPKGYGSKDDPGRFVAFLSDNQATLRVWYLLIYLVFGVCLVFLSLALHERLKTGSPVLTQAAVAFGLIWAVLARVIGTLSIENLRTAVKLYGENPTQAATVWLTLDSVETGLGGGGGETMVNAMWFLLLSWAALQA
jgi:Domain of unknown function (DUF4386)